MKSTIQENFNQFRHKYSIITHVVAALIITVIFLTVYVAVQQVYRSSANDPQLQMARDISDAFIKGKPVQHLMTRNTINLEESLAEFIELFDKNGKAIQSTGLLNGSLPQPPAGVFEFTSVHYEDIITWQPQTGVRMAMVFEKVRLPGEGFIAVGRSLNETETRESNLVKIVGVAWLVCITLLTINLIVQQYFIKSNVK